jgi:hypothetical protein
MPDTEPDCPVCLNLDPKAHPEKWQAGERGYLRTVNHLDLQGTAVRGCRVCSIVLEGIEALQDGLDPIGTETVLDLRCKLSYPFEVGVAEYKKAGCKYLEFFTIEGKCTLDRF